MFLTMYDIALDIAQRAHAYDIREDGDSYINHPLRMIRRNDTEFVRTLKILHDVLEDHPEFEEEIKNLHVAVYTSLLFLTRRKGESYFDFIMRLKTGGSTVIGVKLDDLHDNMRDAKEGSRLDKYRFARYILEKEWINLTREQYRYENN